MRHSLTRFLPVIAAALLLFTGVPPDTLAQSSNTTKLNAPLVFRGSIFRFKISPDSSTVVYSAEQDTNDVRELYSVPIAGGIPIKLSIPFGMEGRVEDFDISPDSRWVIYTARMSFDRRPALYSVPIDGGTSIKLDQPTIENSYVYDFMISDDSSTVIYTGSQDDFLKIE
ncbi:MAG: hypothetical protein AAF787_24660, partial [Chloroflexota bacterium]